MFDKDVGKQGTRTKTNKEQKQVQRRLGVSNSNYPVGEGEIQDVLRAVKSTQGTKRSAVGRKPRSGGPKGRSRRRMQAQRDNVPGRGVEESRGTTTRRKRKIQTEK